MFFLPQTDQTRCYDAAGKNADCAGSGQDAALPKKNAPAERFEIRGNLVHDALTGALWTREANAAGFPLPFDEARAFAADMAASKAHGRSDWRLPPRRLLFSLISHQQTRPALPSGHPFTGVFAGPCWSSDPCRRLPAQVWRAHIGDGRLLKADKQDPALVWPVAGLPARETGGGARFVSEEGGARDTRSGLVWSLEADPAGRPLSWPEALALADAFNRSRKGGAEGWRLPNIRELESLADLDADSPALPPGHPFRNPPEVCWSSTTSVYEPRYAWALYLRDGMVGVGFKPQTSFSAWPVRGPVLSP